MDELLKNDGMTYETAHADESFRPIVEKWSLNRLGYIIKPRYLYKNLIEQINQGNFSIEDLVPKENTVIAITDLGYIKRMTVDNFKSQNRGGKGHQGNADH